MLFRSLGRVEVLGIDAETESQRLKANIGIVPESESPPSYLTPAEFLEFVCTLRGISDINEKVEYWISWFGLQEKRNTMCRDLSKGQRQKVMLASAFIHEPKLYFLDEPDRKSTRLNSSHVVISYAVFCLYKKKNK